MPRISQKKILPDDIIVSMDNSIVGSIVGQSGILVQEIKGTFSHNAGISHHRRVDSWKEILSLLT